MLRSGRRRESIITLMLHRCLEREEFCAALIITATSPRAALFHFYRSTRKIPVNYKINGIRHGEINVLARFRHAILRCVLVAERAMLTCGMVPANIKNRDAYDAELTLTHFTRTRHAA